MRSPHYRCVRDSHRGALSSRVPVDRQRCDELDGSNAAGQNELQQVEIDNILALSEQPVSAKSGHSNGPQTGSLKF